MSDLKRVKKVLSQTLKEKEDNMIKLYLDLFHGKLQAIGVDERLEEIENEGIKYGKELETFRLKHTKQKITELEDKLRALQSEKKDLIEIRDNVRFTKHIIEEGEKLIETIKDCIKNPQKIYEESI